MKRYCSAVVENKSFGKSEREATVPEGLGDWQFTRTGTQLSELKTKEGKEANWMLLLFFPLLT